MSQKKIIWVTSVALTYHDRGNLLVQGRDQMGLFTGFSLILLAKELMYEKYKTYKFSIFTFIWNMSHWV